MGWFTKYGHVVRDENGRMVAKIRPQMLEALLEEFGNEIKLNAQRSKYVYTGEGFAGGTSEMLKVYIWQGYTIDCATVKM